MRGMTIFQKPSYREIRPMRGRPMRGPPVEALWFLNWSIPTPFQCEFYRFVQDSRQKYFCKD